jgi:hypothetical protein
MTSNEVYIDVPRNINKEEVIIDLNQIRFEPRSSPTNDNTIGMSCFSAEHLLLRNNRNKDWLTGNEDNMYERRNMSTNNMFQ